MWSYGFGAACSFVRQRVNFPSVPPSLGCVQMKFCYHQTPFSITCCDTQGAPKNRMCLVVHVRHVCSKEPVKDESSAHQTLFLEVTQRLAEDPPNHSKRSCSEHSFSGSFASRSLEASWRHFHSSSAFSLSQFVLFLHWKDDDEIISLCGALTIVRQKSHWITMECKLIFPSDTLQQKI